jgi:hypothetical protein
VSRRSSLFKLAGGSIILDMRWLSIPLILAAAPASTQYVPYRPAPAPAFAVWNPVAPYITPGQDEPGYRRWYMGAPWRPAFVRSFNNYLVQNGVAGVVPTWKLLRTATSWRRCGGEPFEVPPATEWPHIVQTLRYVHHQVIPAVGPVEPVSAYRNPLLNVCAGGAAESAHKHYSAIDLVPLRPTNRQELIRTLCAVHARGGNDYHVGLGFYAYLRFHVDTIKYRRWGADSSISPACTPIVRPPVIAVVAPPQQQAPPQAQAQAQAQPQPQPQQAQAQPQPQPQPQQPAVSTDPLAPIDYAPAATAAVVPPVDAVTETGVRQRPRP